MPLHASSRKARQRLSGTHGMNAGRGSESGPWVPALRCAAAGMTVAVVGCGPIAVCNDGGGVWDSEAERCYCTYTQQGTYADEPSASQNAWREWCAGLTNLDSIRIKAAVTPAPEGA